MKNFSKYKDSYYAFYRNEHKLLQEIDNSNVSTYYGTTSKLNTNVYFI